MSVVGLLGKAAKASDAAEAGSPLLKGYHGSPYKFDEFSDEAIGSGEGAQAFGYGHYLAQREGTAKSYRDALKSKNADKKRSLKEAGINEYFSDESLRDFSAAIFDAMKGETFNASQVADQIQMMSIEFRGVPKSQLVDAVKRFNDDMKGSMYEVDIDARPDELLDYDLPLSEQTPEIQEKVAEAIKKTQSSLAKKETDELYENLLDAGFEPQKIDSFNQSSLSGNDVLRTLTGNLRMARDAELKRINDEMSKLAKIMNLYEIPGEFRKYTDPRGTAAGEKYDSLMEERSRLPMRFDQESSKILKNAGIKGIKYADAQTRFSPGEKTSNYVIFDPKIIEIARRYGVSVPVAAAALMQSEDASAQPTTRDKAVAAGEVARQAMGGLLATPGAALQTIIQATTGDAPTSQLEANFERMASRPEFQPQTQLGKEYSEAAQKGLLDVMRGPLAAGSAIVEPLSEAASLLPRRARLVGRSLLDLL